MSADYYGRGLSFPVQVGLAGLGQSVGVAKIEESIRIILGTRHGERVMRPEFGSDLAGLVFAPNNTSTANLARYHVEEALRRYEPRIDLIGVEVENDSTGGQLLIHITYRLKATRDVRTLTHPFALEGPR